MLILSIRNVRCMDPRGTKSMNTQQSFMRMLHEDHSTAVRMAYIDFRLRFTGIVNRSDLKEVFGLAEAAASKVLSAYTQKCPKNMVYDRSLRANAINRDCFVSLFSIEADTALEMLAGGFDKSKLINAPILPYSRIGRVPNLLDIETVAKITRALNGGYGIKCNYLSAKDNFLKERVLQPIALMFDGRFWNFRAFERGDETTEGCFKNFSFARTTSVTELLDTEHRRLNHEELAFDREWNNQIPLVLKLHENLDEDEKYKIRRDFGMHENQNDLIVTQRESELWILFKQWFIDCMNEEDKRPDMSSSKFYKFRLLNKDTVEALKTR